jgi:hypothetical protein
MDISLNGSDFANACVSNSRNLVCFKLAFQIGKPKWKNRYPFECCYQVPPSLASKGTMVMALADGFSAQKIQLNIAVT